MLVKTCLGLAFLGFLLVSMLLVTGHAGLAIKAISYNYFFLVLAVFWQVIKYDKEK